MKAQELFKLDVFLTIGPLTCHAAFPETKCKCRWIRAVLWTAKKQAPVLHARSIARETIKQPVIKAPDEHSEKMKDERSDTSPLGHQS